MTDDDTDVVAREAGRLLFAAPWKFLRGARSIADLPPAGDTEIAFAGRSNVGKSSLINALVGQKALARTSNTPGRTQELNFFSAEREPVVADLPGYGYARAPKKDVKAWTGLVFDYFRGRPSLRRVYVLVDARHGLKDNDLAALNVLDKSALSYQIVLTKADKLKPSEVEALLASTREAIRKRPAAHPEVLATAAATGAGIPKLRAEIWSFVNSLKV